MFCRQDGSLGPSQIPAFRAQLLDSAILCDREYGVSGWRFRFEKLTLLCQDQASLDPHGSPVHQFHFLVLQYLLAIHRTLRGIMSTIRMGRLDGWGFLRKCDAQYSGE